MMRLYIMALTVVVAAMVGSYASAAAQEQLPEATDVFTSDMMRMNSSCPQNVGSTLVDRLPTMPMEATEEPMADATEETSTLEGTEEAMNMTLEPSMGPLCIIGAFSGVGEVRAPGDEDGLGLAFVTFDSMTGEVCYEVAVANIELPAQGMHIHIGEAGQSGGVVVPFPTAPDDQGQAAGCTTADDLVILEDLATNPEGYYVNVHTTDYPDGAVRAQLMRLEDKGQRMLESMGLQLFNLRGDSADTPPGASGNLSGTEWRLVSYGTPGA